MKLALAIFVFVAVAGVAAQAPPRVQTSCGLVTGLWDRPGLAAFWGIPFAAAPIGKLRWRPPLPPVCNPNATLNAVKPSPACPQLSASKDVQSEDCLYLNVFSTLAATKKPVLVWIYGGGSVDGSAESYGDIQNIVSALDGNVVLVALNYRLNSFGYFALKELSATDPRGVSGNYGILDCQAALRWVQQHIAAFGGDPARVLVFGQSSGGTQVLGLLASPGSVGLFAAAMSLSGSPNMTMPLAVMERQGLQLVANAGCAGDADVLACLYSKTTAELQRATPQHWSYEGNFREDTLVPSATPPYPGLVIADGVTVLPLPEALAARVVDVPTVLATMACEDDGHYRDVLTWNESAFDTFLASQLRNWAPGTAATVGRLYAPLAASSAGYAYYSLDADAGVTCGNMVLSSIAGRSFRSPVYLVVNTNRPSQFLYTATDTIGKHFPFHTWDTTCAFGTFSKYITADGRPFVPAASDLAYGRLLRSLWYSLAKDLRWPSDVFPVNATPKFPSSLYTVVLSDNATNVLDFKTSLCGKLYDLGFTERFWWVN